MEHINFCESSLPNFILHGRLALSDFCGQNNNGVRCGRRKRTAERNEFAFLALVMFKQIL